MDHHQSENIFATCGQQVDIWKEDRSEPVRSFTWGVDSTHHVKFNPIEVSDYDETFLVLYVLIMIYLLTWLGKKISWVCQKVIQLALLYWIFVNHNE